MSDELRAVAERLRPRLDAFVTGSRDASGEPDTAEWPVTVKLHTAGGASVVATLDLLRLAKAYLAEHPADDGEPATEEWAKSLGLHAYKRLSGAIEYSIRDAFLEFGDGSVWLGVEATGDRIFLAENPTRRHLRMLLWVAGQQLPTKSESP